MNTRLGLVKRTILAGIGSLLLWFASFAQLASDSGKLGDPGPGYDPVPVQLPAAVAGTRRPVTSMDLLTIRDLKGVQISPNGKSVAFVVNQAVYETNSYRTGLFVVDTKSGSKPISLGTAGPPRWTRGEWLDEPPVWSPDSRYITYRLHRGGTWQVWRWNRDGGEPVQLTHTPYDVQHFEWSLDGKTIVLSVEKPPAPAVSRQLSESGIFFDGNIEPFDGMPIVDAVLSQAAESQIWIHEVSSGQEHKASEEEIRRYRTWHRALNDSFVTDEQISPDGKTLAFMKAVESEPGKVEHMRMSLCVQPMNRGNLVELSPDVGYFWWARNSKDIFFLASSEYDRPANLYVVSAEGGQARKLVQFDAFFRQLSLDSNESLAAGALQTPTTPDKVAVADLKTGGVRVLVSVNPEFEELELSPVSEITWKNSKSGPEFAYLIKPLHYEPGKKYPLIVTTYGLARQGFLRGAVGDEYPMQVFAANGFLVLAMNFVPFNEGYEPKNFDDAKNVLWFSLLPKLKAAIKIVEDMGIVDPERKGITGLSYGAHIVDFTISHSDLFQAAISSQLSTEDPFSYYISGRLRQAFESWGLEGLPEAKAWSKWREISPALNAENVKAPLLVNASDSEFRTGLQFYTSLKHWGKAVELFVYPNEFHEKNQPKHRLEIYERNLDWFNFWFKNEEDPNPRKVQQYARWQLLRAQSEQSLRTSK